MKPLDRLSDYLGAIERRLRIVALTRGAAVTALAALALTVVAVIVANNFAFSSGSVAGARVFLFLGLAAAIAAALIVPIIRLNRRHAAREVEKKYPQFQERLLTFTERVEQRPNDPFLELLAQDTLSVAQQAEPREVAKNSLIFGFSTAAIVAMLVLVWLGMSGPGFLGYGTSLLWGGLPKGEMKPFYAIKVEPGNKTIRKRSDLMVSATLTGFQAPKVRFFAKYASASQWEQADMRTEPGGTSYQFLIAGVPESLEYYVEAGGVKSDTYKLNVIDLPSVKNIRVTYHFPSWLGQKDAVEDPGGDLRAVEGTTAEVAVTTDRPLTTGAIFLDDGTKITLRNGADGKLLASVPIAKDGLYHFIAVENGEDVRLSEDYFIEAQKDQAPEIKITRPGRDFRASPIEEVTVQVEGKDDFGLKDVTLHYSVNGGAEKTIAMPAGGRDSKGTATIALEDFKVIPGDVVSLYASAKDARKSVSTDMFFIEAQPFEKNYTQSQQEGGGGGGGGGDEEQNQISQRQKEIITATWNQVKGQGAKATDAENASFLASVQSKLRDQAKSLSDRMKARQLEGAGDSFKSFVQDMDAAVEAMGPASDKLKAASWKDALQPEQKALQHLLRAEATFRDIQVAFGQRGGGGGGGGGGATRDMQGLFDLELDTEKNQYESARSGQQQGGGGQQQAIDEALEKLKQLAKRQQELAEQQRQAKQQTPQQRWEQEMLRRQAEQLQQQLQQAMQNQQLSRSGQQSQQGQQSQSGQSGQQGQQSGQQGQQGQMSRNQQQQQQGGQQGQQNQQQQQRPGQQGQDRMSQANQQQLQQTLDRLKQAVDDMRQAASSQQAGTPQGEAQARRAADRLREAQQMLSGMKDQQSNNQVEGLAQQAEELARKQQEFEGDLRKQFGANSRGVTRDQADQLARQHEQEVADLKRLEQGMQSAVRDLQGTNRQASTKMRDALGDLQQSEIARGMQRNADWIRRGMGQYAVLSESNITAGLNELRDQLKQVQQQLAAGGGKDPKQDKQDQAVENTLRQIEQLRRQMEQMSQQGRNGQQGQRGQQQGQLARGQQQGGQQQGGQQQGGQQQGGQQQGGQQQGGQQQGGQQGGQQQGGQQQGGQQGGQQQGGQQQGGGSMGPNGPATGGNYGGNVGYGNRQYDGRYNEGPVRPEDFQQQYRNTMQSLQQLQQQVQGDPNLARDIQGLMRDLRDINPSAGNNDPLLSERIAAALAGVEQVEMELRRKVEDANGGGSVRSPGGEKVPAGYADKVAEYYRKLGKSK